MSKAAVFTVLAERYPIGKEVAKLRLVLVPVIQAFYTIVSALAAVLFWTLLSLGEFAELRCIGSVFSSLVLYRVEVEARLVVVWASSVWTFKALEVAQD